MKRYEVRWASLDSTRSEMSKTRPVVIVSLDVPRALRRLITEMYGE
jgi:mRNA-degrading endonuclease toxin of MazEF toxin-antitoxin module